MSEGYWRLILWGFCEMVYPRRLSHKVPIFMENVQTENGYTKIANELLDALCAFRIPGELRQVLDCVIRKTYGFHKKEDWISHSQIVQMTKMKKGNVSRELSKAITHKLVVIVSDNKLKLNKNYKEWISFKGNHFNPRQKLSHPITGVIVSDKKVIVSEGNKIYYTKDTYTKDILPDKSGKPKNLSEKQKQYQALISYCREKQGITKEYVNYVKQTTALSKIFKTGYSEADVRFVIDEMWDDPYWHDNTFDMMNVANNMQKYLNRTVYFKKGAKV